jgi:hypothetical protein
MKTFRNCFQWRSELFQPRMPRMFFFCFQIANKKTRRRSKLWRALTGLGAGEISWKSRWTVSLKECGMPFIYADLRVYWSLHLLRLQSTGTSNRRNLISALLSPIWCTLTFRFDYYKICCFYNRCRYYWPRFRHYVLPWKYIYLFLILKPLAKNVLHCKTLSICNH